MQTRKCGECAVCCEQVTVKETGSPAGQPCPFQSSSAAGCCTIHGKPEQPKVCQSFKCAWIQGCGPDRIAHRPDFAGVMFSVNTTPSGFFGFAMEYRKDALLTTARVMLVDFVLSIPYPVIVRSEHSKPPNDFGDLVVIKRSLWPRCQRRLAGKLRKMITEDIGVFDLVIEIEPSTLPSEELLWPLSR